MSKSPSHPPLGTATAPLTPIRAAADAPTGYTILDEAIAMYDGIALLPDDAIPGGKLRLFPPDLPAVIVRASLVAARDGRTALQTSGKTQKGAVSTTRAQKRDARKALAKLREMVDGVFPHGSSARVDFFPSGTGHFDLDARLEAMAAGFRIHEILAPPGLEPEATLALAQAVGAGARGTRAAKQAKQGASNRWMASKGLVREIHKRLGAILRSYFGAESSDLAQFGMQPKRVLLPHTRRKGKKTPEEKHAKAEAARAQREARHAERAAARKARAEAKRAAREVRGHRGKSHGSGAGEGTGPSPQVEPPQG
jgi:hypothetical protein